MLAGGAPTESERRPLHVLRRLARRGIRAPPATNGLPARQGVGDRHRILRSGLQRTATYQQPGPDPLGRALGDSSGAHSLTALTVLFSIIAVFMTEVTSNTASATMLVPLAIAAAQSAGVDPVPPALGCALGCSMAFMLPVATPPNAIVYGSGKVPLPAMMRAGLWLNLAACVMIPTALLVSHWLLGG